jgi:hypothetical protein
METTEPKTFRIPDENLAALTERIAKLGKKALKLCGAAIVMTVLEVLDVPRKNKRGEVIQGVYDRFHVVTVTGPRPVLNGWELVAALDVLTAEDGEKLVYVRAVPGAAVPEALRNDTSGKCDHCQTERARKSTYVVKNTEGEYKTVGSACICDFLGHQSPEAVLANFELLSEAAAFSEESEGGGHKETHFGLAHYLGFVAAAIRADGWLSRTKAKETYAQATADTAFDVMVKVAKNEKADLNPKYIPTTTDWERAEAALTFAKTFLETHGEENDYLHNLSVVSRVGVINLKTAGLAGSLLPTAEREMGKEVERRKFSDLNKNSKHFGAVGEKLFVKATVIGAKELEGNYGVTTLLRFATAEGNLATWFASGSKSDEWEVGKEYLLAATVKAHGDYKGTLQTNLTRVVATTEENKAAIEAKAAKKAARAAKKASIDSTITP